MPNGGSDCCGTCWFNKTNEGRDRPPDHEIPGPTRCLIRDIEIPDPYWTYCANHPHHNPNKIDVPIGPVYVTEGYPYGRKVWRPPPRGETHRTKLLEVLDDIDMTPQGRYPAGADLEEEVLRQVAALKETRALPKLLRIIAFDLEPWRTYFDYAARNNAILVALAVRALLEIGGDEYLPRVAHFIDAGLDDPDDQGYDPETDGLAPVRYHLVQGLLSCSGDQVEALLETATFDPHPQVRNLALHVIAQRDTE